MVTRSYSGLDGHLLIRNQWCARREASVTLHPACADRIRLHALHTRTRRAGFSAPPPITSPSRPARTDRTGRYGAGGSELSRARPSGSPGWARTSISAYCLASVSEPASREKVARAKRRSRSAGWRSLARRARRGRPPRARSCAAPRRRRRPGRRAPGRGWRRARARQRPPACGRSGRARAQRVVERGVAGDGGDPLAQEPLRLRFHPLRAVEVGEVHVGGDGGGGDAQRRAILRHRLRAPAELEQEGSEGDPVLRAVRVVALAGDELLRRAREGDAVLSCERCGDGGEEPRRLQPYHARGVAQERCDAPRALLLRECFEHDERGTPDRRVRVREQTRSPARSHSRPRSLPPARAPRRARSRAGTGRRRARPARLAAPAAPARRRGTRPRSAGSRSRSRPSQLRTLVRRPLRACASVWQSVQALGVPSATDSIRPRHAEAVIVPGVDDHVGRRSGMWHETHAAPPSRARGGGARARRARRRVALRAHALPAARSRARAARGSRAGHARGSCGSAGTSRRCTPRPAAGRRDSRGPPSSSEGA